MLSFEYKNGSVGPLNSGMTRDQARVLLGEYNEFRKNIFSENTTDDFSSSGVHVFYDKENKIKGLEIFEGSPFLFRGENIFDLDASSAVEFFKKFCFEIELIDSGFNVENIGASFYVPDISDDEKAKILSVYIEL